MNAIKKEAKHLLSFLEKWTELDVLYYIKGGATFFSTQLILILASFALSIAFARLTTQDTYGQFQFILAVLGTISILTLPGTNTAVQIATAHKQEGALQQAIKLKLKWSTLATLALILSAGYFYIQNEPRYDHMWIIFLAAIPFFTIVHSYDAVHSYFSGRKKFQWSCLFQLIIEAGSATTAIITILYTKNLLYIILAYLTIQTIGYLLAYNFAKKRQQNHKQDPELTSYSIHLTIINLIPYVKTFFDKIIVTYFLGFAMTAIYSIGASIAEQLYAVSKTISTIALPKMAERKNELNKQVKKHITKLTILFIIIAITAAILTPIIITFFFTEKYAQSIIIAQILLIATIPRAIAYVLSKVQEVQKEKRKMYTVNAIYAGTEIIALVILTPLYGLYGILAAKTLSNFTYLLVVWKTLR